MRSHPRAATDDGIRKELECFAIAYNLIRREMMVEAIRRRLLVNRIGVTSALQRLRYSNAGSSCRPLGVLPKRPNHSEPRVRKRRPKG
ncbi:MAG: hypothetical protein ACKOJF_26715 [Planctomycetaceae bacterium]